jgi:ferrous iron transport protein B
MGLVTAPAWLISLVTDGIIAGVGGVLAFLPGLLVMYFALAFLEDSGYLVRAAFVMDRAMRSLGLHGKSFVPMILGFGCNVPAIYATRTIESRPARILTGLLVPFMSCSARLPIYVVFGLALFPQRGDVVILAMYLLGVMTAALAGLVLSRTVFRDADQGTFVMEMPTYRLPTLRALLSQMWEHSAGFVRKAGTFILLVSVVLWVLMHLPWGVQNPEESYFGQVSSAASPIFAPAGFGTWQNTGALVSGMLAKEVVVSTLAQIYVGEAAHPQPVVEAPVQTGPTTLAADLGGIIVGFGQATLDAGKRLLDVLTPGLTLFPLPEDTGQTGLTLALQRSFTPLTALAFLVFALLYSPCVATIGAQAQEYGWKWALLSTGMTLTIAWGMAVLVFQLGSLLGVA